MIAGMVLFCILVCIFCLGEIYRELHTFQVTHYTVASPKREALQSKETVVFLSDLHNYVYGKDNELLLQAVSGLHPALILIGGDLLVGKEGVSFETARRFAEALTEICPVYYANGNHEQRMKEYPKKYGNAYARYKKALTAAGVHFLENDSVSLRLGTGDIRITGVELPLKTYRKLERHTVSVRDVEKKAGRAESGVFQILLAHNPAYCDAYLEWGADLVLCGHLHGGLVCLPNGKSVITPQFHFFPQYAGEMTEKNGQTVVVSRGLGTHTVNIRLFNRAEVVALHL